MILDRRHTPLALSCKGGGHDVGGVIRTDDGCRQPDQLLIHLSEKTLKVGFQHGHTLQDGTGHRSG